MANSSIKGKNKKIFYDPKLESYFTEIVKIHLMDESPEEFENVAKNTLMDFGENCRYITYESVLKGCSKLLTSNKALPIKEFYTLNTNIITKKLLEEALFNFRNFLSVFLEDIGDSAVSLKDLRSILIQAKDAAVSGLIKHETGWLG